jgi:hypothetical protein
LKFTSKGTGMRTFLFKFARKTNRQESIDYYCGTIVVYATVYTTNCSPSKEIEFKEFDQVLGNKSVNGSL